MFARRALSVVVLAFSAAVPALQAATYTVQNLGLRGDPAYAPTVVGIDNAGRVYGTYFDSDYVPHGYRTTVGGTLATADDVGGFLNAPGDGTFIQTVNANGVFGGYGYDSSDVFPTQGVAYRSNANGTLSTASRIDTEFKLQSQTYAISLDGRAVGYYQKPFDPKAYAFRTGPNGVIDSSSDLGSLGGDSFATGINSNGTTVGFSYVNGNAIKHAFVTSGNQPLSASNDLGTLGGNNSEAIAIGSNNRVVGNSEIVGGFVRAFSVPSNSTLTKTPAADIGTLGGDNSFAYGIDASGDQIVGTAQTAAGVYHAFLYTRTGSFNAGTMIDLNTLIPANSGWVLTDAVGINANGQITGNGLYNGQPSVYLLNVPEPAILGLAGLAIVPLMRRRKSATR